MDIPLEFTPERAWQAGLDFLQTEMSRATFETWVKPAYLIGFEEEMFLVGCPNAYGRDWLASRLTSTLEKSISGLMGKVIKVRFIVHPQAETSENDTTDNSSSVDDVEDDPFFLEELHGSIRNSLLEPGRVVRMPVYYFRWLPYVGSQIIFLVMAFWQSYYLASGGKTSGGNGKISVRAEQVCGWAGLSRAQFFRLIQPGGGLEWFVRKIETDHEVNKHTGRMKKSSNKYVLYDPPLTPGDAEDIKSFLLATGFLEAPNVALQAALAVDPKQILKFPVRLPPENFATMAPHFLTVQDVVQSLLGHRLSIELVALTDQLADRLLAQNEFVLVSWYFLKNWLPIFGPDAAMFILFLRNLCYFNDETGEIRDEVWIEGGYEAIAKHLGIKAPRVVANWLPAVIERAKRKDELTVRTKREFSSRHQLQELIAFFVKRTDHRMNSQRHYAWRFKVQRVDPLIPQDEAILKAVTSLLTATEDPSLSKELYFWLEKILNDSFDTLKKEPKVALRLSNLNKDCSETLKRILNDCFEPLELESKDRFETLLKTLKSIKDSQKYKDTSSAQDSFNSSEDLKKISAEAVIDSTGQWSLEKLLAMSGGKNRHVLLEQEENALPFVSWVIYGASQLRVQSPFGLAISKLKESPQVRAGRAYANLAELPPQQLANLIEQELTLRSPSNRDWQMLFGNLERKRIRLLSDALGFIEEES